MQTVVKNFILVLEKCSFLLSIRRMSFYVFQGSQLTFNT